MKQYFDKVAFSKALKTKRIIDLGIDLREAAKQTKIGLATFSRMENGRVPEMDTFIKACNWLKMSVCEFIKPKK